MYLSYVANRQQFLSRLWEFAKLNENCPNFTECEANPIRGPIRSLYSVQQIALKLNLSGFVIDYTSTSNLATLVDWTCLVTNPHTAPIGKCRIAINGHETNHFAEIALSDTVQAERSEEDILHLVMRKIVQFGIEDTDERMQRNILNSELEVRERLHDLKTYFVTPSMFTLENITVEIKDVRGNTALVEAGLNGNVAQYIIHQHPRSGALAWLGNCIKHGNLKHAYHAITALDSNNKPTMRGVASIASLAANIPFAWLDESSSYPGVHEVVSVTDTEVRVRGAQEPIPIAHVIEIINA